MRPWRGGGGAGRLLGESALLGRGVDVVAHADEALAVGAKALADGDREVADGTQALAAGARRLSSATSSPRVPPAWPHGATTVNSGAATLADGDQKAKGRRHAVGLGQCVLRAPVPRRRTMGRDQLSSGLAQGATQDPTFSDTQQQALALVVSEPVEATHDTIYGDRTNGWLLGGIVGIVLRLAALAAALGRDVGAARRFALTPVSSRHRTAQSMP